MLVGGPGNIGMLETLKRTPLPLAMLPVFKMIVDLVELSIIGFTKVLHRIPKPEILTDVVLHVKEKCSVLCAFISMVSNLNVRVNLSLVMIVHKQRTPLFICPESKPGAVIETFL